MPWSYLVAMRKGWIGRREMALWNCLCQITEDGVIEVFQGK